MREFPRCSPNRRSGNYRNCSRRTGNCNQKSSNNILKANHNIRLRVCAIQQTVVALILVSSSSGRRQGTREEPCLSAVVCDGSRRHAVPKRGRGIIREHEAFRFHDEGGGEIQKKRSAARGGVEYIISTSYITTINRRETRTWCCCEKPCGGKSCTFRLINISDIHRRSGIASGELLRRRSPRIAPLTKRFACGEKNRQGEYAD